MSKRMGWLSLTVLMFWGLVSTASAFTITRTSAPVFYLDTGDGVTGNYVAYRITNDGGSPEPAVWVTINNFQGGVVGLATHETGQVFLGSLGVGESKMAYFYLQANAETLTDQTHDINIHTSVPPSTPVLTQPFTLADVQDAIAAQANKPLIVVSTPNPPYLGGTVVVTLTGATGTIGGAQDLYYTAAHAMGWRADAFRLYKSTITFTGGNNVVKTDELYFTLPNSADSDYEAVFEFRIQDMVAVASQASPLAFIRSGQQMKYVLTDPATIPPINPPLNSLLLSKSVSTNLLSNGGTVTYSLTLTNSSIYDVQVSSFTDTLPTSPAAATYVPSSSLYNGLAIGNPGTNGAALTWFGPFAVPAGAARTLSFAAILPSTFGSYTNQAIATAGDVQVDTTQATDDNAPATAVTLVGTQADLQVLKSGPATVTATSNLTYTVAVTNLGPDTATSVVVTDSLPAGVSFVSATGSPTQNGSQLEWTLVSLAANAGSNFEVVVTAPASGLLTNFASVGSTDFDPVAGNNSTNVITTVNELADLALFKSGPASIGAGSNLTYTLTVTNLGPSTASSLVLTDSLPAGVSFVSATGGGTENGGVVTWALASLAAGAGSSFDVTVTPPGSGTLTNLANVGAASIDADPSNNDASAITTINEISDVAILKSGPLGAEAGSNITYTVAVTNFGPSIASSIVVTDTLPASVSFVSATGSPAQNGNVLVWSIPTLAASAGASFEVVVTAPGSGILTNSAAGGSSVSDPDTANNSTNVTTTITSVADLVVGKIAPATVGASSNFSYTVSITNLGPSAATSVVVTDSLPAAVSFVSASGGGSQNGGVVTWPTIASLAAGAGTSFEIVVTAPAEGLLTNSVIAGSTVLDPFPANNTTNVITAVTSFADLSVTKQGAAQVFGGSSLDYTITVSNAGPSSASSLVVTDTLPAGVSFVSASAGGSANGSVVTWSLPSLAANSSTNLSLTVLTPYGGILTNVAAASSSTSDPDPSNNDGSTAAAQAVTTVAGITATGFVYLDANQNNNRDGGEAGTSVDLWIKFVGPVTNAVSVDPVTGGFSANSLPPGTYTILVSTNADLSELTAAAPAGWIGTENATLVLADQLLDDGPLPELEFGLFAPLPADKPLFVQKEASVKEAEIGDSVTYTIKIKNVSTNTIAGIVLTDILPAGFTYVAGTTKLDGVGQPNPLGAPGAKLQFNIGSLDPNVTATLTYRAQIGVGALQGTGLNKAQVLQLSNLAQALVRVNAGVFTDKAFIIGKVFADYNANKIQDQGEPGVPGVRLWLQNGNYVVTDSEGKYNFYGLSPRTHVVKVDEITLPAGAKLEKLSPRHDSRGATYLADLKRGELRKVNFAILSPAPAVVDNIQKRRKQIEVSVAEIQQTIRPETVPGPLPQATIKPPVATPARGTAQPAVATYESLAERPVLSGNLSAVPARPVPAGDNLVGLGRVLLALPDKQQPADGLTPATIGVSLVDAAGQPIKTRSLVTLESSLGRWQVEDADRKEPGIQTYLENGRGEFVLLPPQEAGDALIIVSSGSMRGDAKLAFVPALRPMMAVGVVEGRLSLHKLDLKNLMVARQDDGFEQELRNWTFSGGSGHMQGGARAALFLKGKVKGDYLLTLAYDSDKEAEREMFRDIDPDKYYPVYGDSAVRGFDAQSTSRLYVRLEKNKCYLFYGDYATGSTTPARGLGDYNRALTGAKYHHETSNLVVNAWAAYDNSRQVIREFRADGTSGPYFLGAGNIIDNSERVEILTRDRNQPSLILRSVTLARFTDYEFEPFANRLLFRAPVPSLDENLNPISIRVTYESEGGGEKFWIYGADGQVKLHPRFELGGSIVRDENPLNEYQLHSANTTVKLAENTFLLAEVAQSNSSTNDTGTGARIELRHDSAAFGLRIWGAYVEQQFDNPSSPVAAGRQELGARLIKPLTPQTRLLLEAIDTRDLETDGERWGVLGGLEHRFANNIRLELGGRYAHENEAGASDQMAEVAPNEVISIRAKITAPVPRLERATVYAEAENDVVHTERHLFAVGASYQVEEKTRMYARHEFIDSLGGAYELNSSQEQNTTVFGVETEYMRDGHLFNEYRARDAFNGRDAEAAIGLRNGWNLGEGLRAITSFERVHPIYGTNDLDRATAVALGLEYLGATDWKASGRIEYRDSDGSDRWLNTLGLATKLSLDWTALAKSILLIEDNKNNLGDRFQSRLQLGAAWRQTDNDIWNALFLYEYKYEKDELAAPDILERHVNILSAHLNWHPQPKWTVSGRYAMKVTEDEASPDYYMAHLVGTRIMYELTERWSIGLNGSVMFDSDFSSTQYGLGPDIGFRVSDNLWLDVGYNLVGFHDADLSGANYTDQGFHLGVRMQFDEHLFDFAKKNK